MPSIFTLPKQVVLGTDGRPLAGALVYFYQTGTSTPQNTYQDEALTTPHANPVVADGSGVLPVIYFDASLPDYRVRVENSATVLQYQVDSIPSSQDETTSFRITSAAPEIVLDETDAASGSRKWRIRVNGAVLSIAEGNDAESIWTDIFSINRGTDTISIAANWELNIDQGLIATETLTVNGETMASIEIGSYTGTLTGLTTSPTVTVNYRRAGNIVTLSYSQQTATSNTNALTVTGMPASIRPAVTRQGICVGVVDNGTAEFGQVGIFTTGDLVYSRGAAAGTFTASGGKGVGAATITYHL